MSLQEAQLQKRSSELDAREAFIDAKQKILDDSPITLKVYEARVKAYETKLQDLIDAIRTESETHEQRKLERSRELNQIANKITIAQATLDKTNDAINKAELTLDDIKTAIKQGKKEIEQHNLLLQQQEGDANEAIGVANERLLDLQDLYNGLEDSIKKLKSEETGLKKTLDDLIVERDKLFNNLEKAAIDFEDQSTRQQNELTAMNTRIAEASREHTVVKVKIDKKLAILKEKEESLMARQDAIRLEKQELDTEKRRVYSTKSLYDNV